MVKKTSNLKYYEAVGRRKSAVARIRLYLLVKEKEVDVKGLKIKKGEFFVNGKMINQYFKGEPLKMVYERPLVITDNKDRFAISAKIVGGGLSGQIDALVLALSRALDKSDKEYKKLLKSEKLLSVDSRIREKRKVGTGGKARRKKQSPKR